MKSHLSAAALKWMQILNPRLAFSFSRISPPGDESDLPMVIQQGGSGWCIEPEALVWTTERRQTPLQPQPSDFKWNHNYIA